ncbi:hypothetical protein P171DRAFT_109840 [Karstenula rhodostoma CBS 690.94]|uniref:Uncharacterized protein n=1 Tax=Karstenula rhodostoma CBS 690.94 TaxID=1392251 RepID=A0A9P4PAV4_9PLEO|nr:hypothetical protein P171DRAFT_109840 [Karstenula rhodostoma CBS 690.94]
MVVARPLVLIWSPSTTRGLLGSLDNFCGRTSKRLAMCLRRPSVLNCFGCCAAPPADSLHRHQPGLACGSCLPGPGTCSRPRGSPWPWSQSTQQLTTVAFVLARDQQRWHGYAFGHGHASESDMAYIQRRQALLVQQPRALYQVPKATTTVPYDGSPVDVVAGEGPV